MSPCPTDDLPGKEVNGTMLSQLKQGRCVIVAGSDKMFLTGLLQLVRWVDGGL